jgi:citronellol/citronellal dehydrogenase
VSKYGMSMITLGIAEEHRGRGPAANYLWPRTLIATAATAMLHGADESVAVSRTPQIMAGAAYAILTRPAEEATGNCYLDDDVPRDEGVTNLDGDRADPASTRPLQLDVCL